MSGIKKIMWVSMLSLWLFMLEIRVEANDNEILTILQNGIKYHVQMIKTALMRYEVVFGKEMDKKIVGNLYIKDAKKSLEAEFYENGNLLSRFKVVFADSVGKSLYKGNSEINEPSSGSIFPGEPPEFAYPNPSRLFLTIFGKNITETIDTMQLIGREKIDDQDCYILTGSVGKSRKYRMWIDPNRDCSPLKIVLSYGEEGTEGFFQAVVQNIKLLQKDGIWFPIYAEILSEDPDIVPAVINISEVQLNKELADEIFDIKFPPGTGIYDKFIGSGYYIPE